MARSIKLPLISGGVLVFFWGGIGTATIMGLADVPRELPHWREMFASVLIGLILAYIPLYVVMLVASLVLKWKKMEAAAYRASLIPFSVPLVFAILLAAYFFIPGRK